MAGTGTDHIDFVDFDRYGETKDAVRETVKPVIKVRLLRRRTFLRFAAGFSLVAVTGRATLLHAAALPAVEKLNLSDKAWRERLTPEQYDVLRFSQTEFAGSSELNHEYREGTYVCAGCDLPLFKSDWKYNSRTGWPSFWRAFDEHLTTRKPIYAFRAPTEYRCARCDGHHGHIFEDGPQPTGLRYCSNGAALRFIPA